MTHCIMIITVNLIGTKTKKRPVMRKQLIRRIDLGGSDISIWHQTNATKGERHYTGDLRTKNICGCDRRKKFADDPQKQIHYRAH